MGIMKIRADTGRDALTPLAIAYHTLSLHFKGSDFGAGERRWEKATGAKKRGRGFKTATPF
jgi:hypothetical protein